MLTHLERMLKAQEIWKNRDALIDLSIDFGNQHGADDPTYLRMKADIEAMAKEAEALERDDLPYQPVIIHADIVQLATGEE